jgi:sporulation protein YlmC with PRC-barrel domain
MAARELYLGAHLLDRQMLARDGRRCGKVDDVELEADPETGHLFVRALHCGPGALLTRTGHTRLGHWLRRAQRWLDDGEDRGVVPLRAVADIGAQVRLSLDADELATEGGERWVSDHLIGPIPGSGRRARQ